MVTQNLPMTQRVGILGNIDPDANAAGTLTTGWIAAKDYKSFVSIVQAGDLGTSATIAARLQQASDSSGTGVKDITGKAITTMTQAGTDTSNRQRLINLRQTELDQINGFTHFRLSMTGAVATSDYAGIVLGIDPTYGPATSFDASTVDEVIS